MKERLTMIFNLMQRIETHGDSTLYMADCLRELADVINNAPDHEHTHDEVTIE